VVELLGYLASAILIFSLTRRSVVWLRIIGLVGAALFAVYALLVGAIPVAITNGVIICIHSYFLWQAYRYQEFFSLLEVQPSSPYLGQFLDFHRADIARYQPDFDFALTGDDMPFLVLRDMVPAGVFIGRETAPGVVAVRVDYVTPQYRDLKTARFLFRRPGPLEEHGITTVTAAAVTDAHRRYLTRLGFEPTGPATYRLVLQP